MSAPTIETLIKKRGIIKSKLTRFSNYLNTLAIDTINEDERSLLQSKVTKLDTIFSDFSAIQYEIGVIGDNADMHEVESEEFEEKFFKSHSTAHSILQKSACIETSGSVNCESMRQESRKVNVKKPPINLPTFDGSFEKWCHFRDLFKSMIHSDSSLSNVEKLHYLNISLKGEAAVILNSISISDDNYSVAWDLLHERYENMQLIVQSHIQALFDINTIKRESYRSLRELLDSLVWHVKSLEKLDLPVKHWDALLIHLISMKLDVSSKKEWDLATSNDVNILPTYDDLVTFLNKRCRLLGKSSLVNEKEPVNKSKTNSLVSVSKVHCNYCNKSHFTSQCDAILNLSVNDRINEIKRRHLCINCLAKGHNMSSCRSKHLCKRCQKRHHTILHIEHKPEINCNTEDSLPSTAVVTAHASTKNSISQVLLSTVCVRVIDSLGKWHHCTALLDSGSQSNFITNDFHTKLKLPRHPIRSTVLGINQATINLNYKTNVHIHSVHGAYETTLSCLIIKKITENMPMTSFDASCLNIPSNINLANPKFNEENKINMLLGAPIFWNLLCVGQIQLGKGNPTLQKTRLGWIISGPISIPYNLQTQQVSCNLSINLENLVEKFWSIEECNFKRKWSVREQECEAHFVNTVSRDHTGRFRVSIPFNSEKSNLGESRHLALKRFFACERRLNQNLDLKQEYVKFMTEYEEFGHMRLINEADYAQGTQSYYFPHHAVIKATSTTTKTRVVFDGSAKTTTGVSLNDAQEVGPVIQDDIFTLLLRFREHAFVLTADVEKMYRQILISNDDLKYHRIFWRSDSSQDLKCYELQTITYGTASASFLATRCLQQLTIDFRSQYPEASNIIERDFYMDDLLTGANSIHQLDKLKREIAKILDSAGLKLRKWLSNCSIQFDDLNDSQNYHFGSEGESRTLGISWNPKLDEFVYEISQISSLKHVTKRVILATTAKIFDPLGLLGPIIIVAKLIIQRLWQCQLSWDESIPHDLHHKWNKFLDEISSTKIRIPRFILQMDAKIIECHGFADASERAYGACVYARCLNASGDCSINLLCAKSRVAPLHQLTLPRLELCAATLLIDLIVKVRESITIQFNSYHFWSDSTIVLSWIKAHPSKWQTFVANRVSKIQSHSDPQEWFHVKSQDNPADLLSRGTTLSTLLNSTLWWHGTSWLTRKSTEWPINHSNSEPIDEIPEQRKIVVLTTKLTECSIFEKFSSFSKLQRITAWILRFAANCRKGAGDRQSGSLSVTELNNSLIVLVRVAQNQSFSEEIAKLQKGETSSFKGNLASLNPILDDHNILRVGGRLKYSNFSFDKKHPIVLPKNHLLTDMLIIYEHKRLLHGGAQAVLFSLRERFWPIAGRNRIKKLIRNCVICFKANPLLPGQYLMGDLPDYRITAANAFQKCGVDYAGPFMIKDRRTRGNKITKAYICLFVCMVTKAIHLELVSNLTTDAFLSTLRRFISRRGKPSAIYSDNGTNFVGAQKELRELSRLARGDGIQNFSANECITWHFMPPRSPHFGGLWEAGVKSTKAHLKRVLGNASLTFEDFYTVLTQIEAVLNSRPISPLSNDPNDLDPLTPGHFLTGRPLVALPEPDFLSTSERRLSLYQRLQKLVQNYWARWHKEYVSELQTRCRWRYNKEELLEVGALVILREDNLPPCHWTLGRILQLHPGTDGIVRVVTVKTLHKVLKRPVVKLCVLPIN